MLILRRIVNGLRRLFHKDQVEQDMDEELRAYLETAAEQKMAAGLNREAAVRAARVEIGSLDAIKEGARDIGWESTVESFWQDIRHAFRLFSRTPIVTATALLTIALGVGGSTAVFSVVYAVMLRPLPYPAPDRLVELFEDNPRANRPMFRVSTLNYLSWAERATSTEALAAFAGRRCHPHRPW